MGHEDRLVGTALNNLAGLYLAEGRYAEAEPLFKRSLDIREKALGPEDPAVGTALLNLATLYVEQGRYVEAELLYKRSLAIWEKALPEHPNVGLTLNNMAELYRSRGSYAEAEPLYKRSLTVWEKALGPEHPKVGYSLNNLARLYQAQGRYAEAEPLYKRSLAVWERAMGPEHPLIGNSYNNLALLFQAEGRYAEAESLYERALIIREKALGLDHPYVALTLNNLATLYRDQGNWARAADYWRRSTGVLTRRAARGLAGASEGLAQGEVQRSSWQYAGLVKASYRLAEGRDRAVAAAEMFETAQWSQASEAAVSLAQMAARSATGSSELAGLVRERQDLVGEWQAADKRLTTAKSEEPANRKPEVEKALGGRLAAIDARLAEIGRRLAKDFPDYAALASAAPASVVDVQAQLGADEALVLFLDTPEWKSAAPNSTSLPEESFVWVVTRWEVRWVRSELGTARLKREVAALRCGLDDAAWVGDGVERCAKALGLTTPLVDVPDPLPFDLARAHRLYTALFRDVQDLIAGRHLLIVPSGALTQLPFGVLVTDPPKTAILDNLAGYREAAWLGTRQPITVLPAVSSLKALRAHVRPSGAAKPYLGFGNPLVDGDQKEAEDVERARLAREKQHCRPATQQQVAALGTGHAGVGRVVKRSGLADVVDIRLQAPLPETADELCAVAQDVQAGADDVHLGAQATEAEVKRLSAAGDLARYHLLHFATHGAMAGELDGTHEPGLILTPPETATEEDDGYLSASEIAALKLDADWVILSACNTAAGGAANAEALSGVARAFIYAGARALLVSHWAVYSGATAKLIAAAAAEIAHDPRVGRAEAMRRAMQALIEKGTPIEAHPAFWAPFIVVGEGAAAR